MWPVDAVGGSSPRPAIGQITQTAGSALGPGQNTEAAVLDHVRAYPEFHQKIREFSQAVSAAGVRVRDFGLLRSEYDDNLRVFAPECQPASGVHGCAAFWWLRASG
jgi:hypothetical protein